MGLETGVTYIDDLVSTNPVGATDNVDEGDDHIRNIKTAVQGSFPSLGSAAVTKTAAQVNDLATLTGSETLTNKTLTTPTITSPVINTGVSGTAILDEDDMATDSATQLATQQSIKAYIDALPALTLLDTPISLLSNTSTSATSKTNIDITAHTTGVATKAILRCRVEGVKASSVATNRFKLFVGEPDETFSAVHEAAESYSEGTASNTTVDTNTVTVNLKSGELLAWETTLTGGAIFSQTTTIHLVGYYV